MSSTENPLGKRIADARDRRGLLQKDVAKEAGVSVSFLSEIENGKRTPGSEVLLRIADVLGASLDYLLRGEAGPSTPKAITIPPALQEAAEREEWSYGLTADLLKAQAAVMARRTPEGGHQRRVREWGSEDWVRLYESLFPDG